MEDLEQKVREKKDVVRQDDQQNDSVESEEVSDEVSSKL